FHYRNYCQIQSENLTWKASMVEVMGTSSINQIKNARLSYEGRAFLFTERITKRDHDKKWTGMDFPSYSLLVTCTPPAAETTLPVIMSESSSHRKPIRRAKSSPEPGRPTGVLGSFIVFAVLISISFISPLISPGDTMFAVIPFSASSLAIL